MMACSASANPIRGKLSIGHSTRFSRLPTAPQAGIIVAQVHHPLAAHLSLKWLPFGVFSSLNGLRPDGPLSAWALLKKEPPLGKTPAAAAFWSPAFHGPQMCPQPPAPAARSLPSSRGCLHRAHRVRTPRRGLEPTGPNGPPSKGLQMLSPGGLCARWLWLSRASAMSTLLTGHGGSWHNPSVRTVPVTSTLSSGHRRHETHRPVIQMQPASHDSLSSWTISHALVCPYFKACTT